MVFTLLVLVLFIGYLRWDNHRLHVRQEILVLKEEGDRLQNAGQYTDAINAYDDVTTRGNGWADLDIRHVVDRACASRDDAKTAIVNLQIEKDRLSHVRQAEEMARARILASVTRALSRFGLALHPAPIVAAVNVTANTSAPSPTYSGTSGGSGSSVSSSYSGGRVQVRGYYRKNGTYVSPHTRSAPRRR